MVIFCPRRFLADSESVVNFFGFLVDFLAPVVGSELLLFVAAYRIVVFVIFVEFVVRKGFDDNAKLHGEILESFLNADD